MKCGYAIKDITPALGCHLAGNTRVRPAEGVRDPICCRAVVFQNEGTAVLLSYDLVGMIPELIIGIREYVAEHLGLERKDIFVTSTHSHTAPNVSNKAFFPLAQEFMEKLPQDSLEVAQAALADMKESQFLFAKSNLEGVSFIRRYRMKDGTIRTNPGRRNPDILEPAAEADTTIQLLRITREDAGDIALVNFQVHPDVVHGTLYSADYPAVVCNVLEAAIPGLKCMYCNGAAGDLNHIDVNCPEWDKNNGPDHAVHMGRTIAGKILSMYTKARPIEAGPVKTIEERIVLQLRKVDPSELPEAEEIMRLYKAGLRDQIDASRYQNNMNIAIYQSRYKIQLYHENGERPVMVSALSLGDIAIAGIPGEPFCDLGRQIRNQSPFDKQIVIGLTNGYDGYFPTAQSFAEGGYEAATSHFLPGVGETLVETSLRLLHQLSENKE